MKANIYDQYNAAVIELKGKVEGGPFASEFKQTLQDLLNQNKKNIVVDMSDIKFINSNGIGILVSGYMTVKNGGGELKLVNLYQRLFGVSLFCEGFKEYWKNFSGEIRERSRLF